MFIPGLTKSCNSPAFAEIWFGFGIVDIFLCRHLLPNPTFVKTQNSTLLAINSNHYGIVQDCIKKKIGKLRKRNQLKIIPVFLSVWLESLIFCSKEQYEYPSWKTHFCNPWHTNVNANCWVMTTRSIWETRQNPLGKIHSNFHQE